MNHCLKLHFLLACVLLVVDAPAADYPAEVGQRIAAIETSLLPPVQIKGRTKAATIADRMAHFS